jgi:acyl carrier protein
MEIKNEIKKIFFDVFSNLNDENFDYDAKQEDYLNWDSFAHLELMTSTETKFNIKISPEDALSIRTALDLTKLVESRI